MNGNNLDVLMVEDNEVDVELTREGINEAGAAIALHVVGDGTDALDYLHRRNGYADAQRPDLMLLDLNLPKVGGTEVLERIKSDPDLRRIPVIVLSSSSAEADIIASYDRHANGYMTKPMDIDQFSAMVASISHFWLDHACLPPR